MSERRDASIPNGDSDDSPADPAPFHDLIGEAADVADPFSLTEERRRLAAADPSTPAAVLRRLAEDPSPAVRAAVAANRSADTETVMTLAADVHGQVLRPLTQREDLPTEAIPRLFSTHYYYLTQAGWDRTLSSQHAGQALLVHRRMMGTPLWAYVAFVGITAIPLGLIALTIYRSAPYKPLFLKPGFLLGLVIFAALLLALWGCGRWREASRRRAGRRRRRQTLQALSSAGKITSS